MRVPDLSSLRVEYETTGIDPASMAEDPLEEFVVWFQAAAEAGIDQPNSFVLATSTLDGVPSARAVLLKEIGPEGLSFYTNIRSRKGRELAGNPRAAACFVWMELHRQVRIEGTVERVADADADAYFSARPPGSRLSAAASHQSEVVPSREVLEERYRELQEAYPSGDVPRPREWGGFRILPRMYEFWQGRPHRFHDRVRYREEGSAWVRERLAP
ncbi:MAG: pyridoxamine 5'-phosphate oxidase [Actinomycetota bacterium]